MTGLIFEIREDPGEDFTARALETSVFSEADTLDELKQNVRDAVKCHFDPENELKLLRLVIVREGVIAA